MNRTHLWIVCGFVYGFAFQQIAYLMTGDFFKAGVLDTLMLLGVYMVYRMNKYYREHPSKVAQTLRAKKTK